MFSQTSSQRRFVFRVGTGRWLTFNTQSMLGGSLAEQQKFAEAEPLLLTGFTGMQERLEKILIPLRIRLDEAIQRLIDLYSAWNKPAEAERWREELNKTTPEGG